MAIDDEVRDEKLQYDINREAANLSTLLSGKLDKYENLSGEEIVPFNQKQIIEQAKFPYSHLEKAPEKQAEKQVDVIKFLDPFIKLKNIEGIFLQSLINDLIRDKLKEIFKLQDLIKKQHLNYKSKREKN